MEDKLKKSLLSVAFRDFSDKNCSKTNQENPSHILHERNRVLFKDLPLNSKLNGECIMDSKVYNSGDFNGFHLASKTLLSRRCPKNIRGGIPKTGLFLVFALSLKTSLDILKHSKSCRTDKKIRVPGQMGVNPDVPFAFKASGDDVRQDNQPGL